MHMSGYPDEMFTTKQGKIIDFPTNLTNREIFIAWTFIFVPMEFYIIRIFRLITYSLHVLWVRSSSIRYRNIATFHYLLHTGL